MMTESEAKEQSRKAISDAIFNTWSFQAIMKAEMIEREKPRKVESREVKK